MSKTALVLLAPGTEEMEFVISVDVLRRGGLEVTVGGVDDCQPVKCSRGVNIVPDVALNDVRGPFDVVVLPGGLGGSKAFANSEAVGNILKEQESSGGYIAAICAAPTALRAHSIGVGKFVTSYPSTEQQMTEGAKYKYKSDNVVVDETLITSRGPGTAYDFALTIVEKLLGKEKACEVAKAMLVPF